MASKRNFKKNAETLGAVIVEEMLFAYVNLKDADKDAISSAIGDVLDAVEAARKNANVTFDRGPKAFADPAEYRKEKDSFYRALFRKISGEFDATVNEALKKFNGALPQEVKNALKDTVAK